MELVLIASLLDHCLRKCDWQVVCDVSNATFLKLRRNPPLSVGGLPGVLKGPGGAARYHRSLALAAQVGPSWFILALLVVILSFLFAILVPTCSNIGPKPTKDAQLKDNIGQSSPQDAPRPPQVLPQSP